MAKASKGRPPKATCYDLIIQYYDSEKKKNITEVAKIHNEDMYDVVFWSFRDCKGNIVEIRHSHVKPEGYEEKKERERKEWREYYESGQWARDRGYSK